MKFVPEPEAQQAPFGQMVSIENQCLRNFFPTVSTGLLLESRSVQGEKCSTLALVLRKYPRTSDC
jgi:hypothetical protein